MNLAECHSLRRTICRTTGCSGRRCAPTLMLDVGLTRLFEKIMKSRIKKFYAQIPESQKKYIEDFEKAHSEKRLDVIGVMWHYFDSEDGKEVLLLGILNA